MNAKIINDVAIIAGDILQKFVNYGIKFAIFGDFTGYTSKPLKDFIYESLKEFILVDYIIALFRSNNEIH